MQLPTSQEINPFNDLDGQHAERHFLGLTLDEAEALFRENSIYYQEDLMFMGAAAFRFYVHAAIQYIQSESSTGDSGMISCFAAILEYRAALEIQELVPIAGDLESVCISIVDSYDRFDLMPEVYGDIRPRYKALQQKFAILRQAE